MKLPSHTLFRHGWRRFLSAFALDLSTLVVFSMLFSVLAHPAKGQQLTCNLSRSSTGVITGQCQGVPSPPSRPDPNPVSVQLHPEDGKTVVWTGTMEIWDTSYDLQIAPYEYPEAVKTVVRTPFGWFIPSKLDLKDDPPELAWSVEEDEAPPSPLDRRILERARELLSDKEAWDRNDDRECSPSDTTYSLYCAVAEATRQLTGEYRHRQPALQVVRRLIEQGWPERIENHRLMNFNNDSRTTHADLIEALDRSERRLRQSLQ